jgi:hypothetical protein
LLACFGPCHAGEVVWSDGHKLEGTVSLTPGKDLQMYTASGVVAVALPEVKAIHFKPEKEQMWEGFYFPNAGQATQIKTGEVYPIRYLATELTLADGKVLTGHLFTTVFYIETDDATQKVVMLAKQTGPNGTKLADLIYPTDIRMDEAAADSTQIDLSQAGFVPTKPPVVMVEPELEQPPLTQTEGKPIWTVPVADSSKVLFSVEAADGLHVAWPLGASTGNEKPGDPAPLADVDPDISAAVRAALQVMQDFYDNRTLLGSFAAGDGNDIYSVVLLKRLGKSVNGAGTPTATDITPWSVVLLRWKYDPDAKKVTLLSRVPLAIGRAKDGVGFPTVLREPTLLRDVTKEN